MYLSTIVGFFPALPGHGAQGEPRPDATPPRVVPTEATPLADGDGVERVPRRATRAAHRPRRHGHFARIRRDRGVARRGNSQVPGGR